MLNEKEASQLSDIDFQELVIRKLNELTTITKKYRETTMNSLQTTSKGNRNYQQGPRGNEEYNF